MADENTPKKIFWTRKVSLWHIVYIVIICLIVNVFLLCIVPGRVNDEAYQNFSFAATIVSIVLAVVSIVYSLQSGLSSIGQLNGIKDIEAKIGTELTRFSDLESSIKNAVQETINPLQASMGDIQQKQDDIQKAQDELAKNWKEFSTNVNSITNDGHQDIDASELAGKGIPQILCVIFYVCLCSKETGKDLPYHILGKFFGNRSYYCEGVINGLSVLKPDLIKVKTGSKPTRQTIDVYNEGALGSKEWLTKQIKEGKNTKLGENILVELNSFFFSDDSSCSVS